MKEIKLTQGRVALVDDDDYENISRWKWYAYRDGKCWYAYRARKKDDGPGPNRIIMHRVILGVSGRLETDHINGDGLDNRKGNLRMATPAMNQQNQHRRKATVHGLPMGVFADVRGNSKRFRAYIHRAGKQIHLGCFGTPEAAKAAYVVARDEAIAEHEAMILKGDKA